MGVLDYITGLVGYGNNVPIEENVYRVSQNNLQYPEIQAALANEGVDINNMQINPLNNKLEYIVPNTTTNNGFLGLDGSTWSGIGAGIQGLSGLANAYLGYKNYQLAQNQFKFQKGLANRNIANQAKIINNTYDNAAQVAAGMVGGKDSRGNYGMTDQNIVNRYANRARTQYVDGSPIG